MPRTFGGLIGARLAPALVARFGQHNVPLTAGTLRACWSVGVAFMPNGAVGIILVFLLQFGLVTCAGIFNPALAAYRHGQIEMDRTARILSAWSITSSASIAVLTALWGVLAGLAGACAAIAISGLFLLFTPFLLPWRALAAINAGEAGKATQAPQLAADA